jgi:hypothetical protein
VNKKNKRKTQESQSLYSKYKIAEKIRQTKTKVDLSVFKLQELQKPIEKKKKRNTRTTKTNWEKMERG